MTTPTDLQTFDRALRELTGTADSARPFLCEGSPFEGEVGIGADGLGMGDEPCLHGPRKGLGGWRHAVSDSR